MATNQVAQTMEATTKQILEIQGATSVDKAHTTYVRSGTNKSARRNQRQNFAIDVEKDTFHTIVSSETNNVMHVVSMDT